MGEKQPDFSGWATKSDLKCADGRTIMAGAFKHMDKVTVPLVWMHQHSNAENVLGHAVLEDRAFGTYTYGYFNHSEAGQHAKQSVQNGDIESLSIYANNLTERMTRDGKQVFHGDIKEVSLVLAGANPGALIEHVNMMHGDELIEMDDEAIIHTGLALEHRNQTEGDSIVAEKTDEKKIEEKSDEELQHAEADLDEKTVGDVLATLTPEQELAVQYTIGVAVSEAKASDDEDEDAKHDNIMDGEEFLAHVDNHIKEGISEMTRNLFDQDKQVASKAPVLTHDQFATIMKDGSKFGTLKESVLQHAAEYGIENIDLLFPDAKVLSKDPELNARRMEWVSKVLGGTKHAPFAKIKSLTFDLTEPEARAKGYIKGNMKKDEVIQLMKRTTSPTTIYKKQKLDRDDILDITDMDVVAWLKAEIRLMLEEEIARAILVGDGRSASDEDKIKDPAGATDGTGIRSILHDADFYAIKHNLAANVSPKDAVKGLIRARAKYRGSGKPTLFVSDNYLTDVMLEEDKFGRPLYETEAVLADKLRVSDIVTVDLFDETPTLFAIMVNLQDYTIGSNKGGELTSFEDFDIDFNQHKYLMETRLSGALTKPFSAVVVTRALGTAATATAPSFDGATNTITIPTATGVVYEINDAAVTGDVVITEDTTVVAQADEGYYIPANSTTEWNFTYTP